MTMPRGREEIRRAVLDAAAELFSQRRPSQVSVREIADAAGVNHALVHRHFGTKEQLVREVLERTDVGLADAWGSVDDLDRVIDFLVGSADEYREARVIYEGALLDGMVFEDPPARLLDGIADRLVEAGAAPATARARAAVVVGVSLGWATYGTSLADAAGADHAEAASLVRGLLRELTDEA